MSDLLNSSPNLATRTPGQLLSLTTHLSFGSGEKKPNGTHGNQTPLATSNFMNAINRQSKLFRQFTLLFNYVYKSRNLYKSIQFCKNQLQNRPKVMLTLAATEIICLESLHFIQQRTSTYLDSATTIVKM